LFTTIKKKHGKYPQVAKQYTVQILQSYYSLIKSRVLSKVVNLIRRWSR